MSLIVDAPGARPCLSIVVPVYQSEACLKALAAAVTEAMESWGRSYELILVNDGSADGSWNVIESLCAAHPNIIGVDLRRNFGQDNAILTGLRFAHGVYVGIMDDDLQHHPKHLPALVAKLEEGFDVVYAHFRVRNQRPWKILGSWFNGKVAEWVLDKPRHLYLSAYKVLRHEVAELVAAHDGPEPYVDGLLLQVTSRLTQIPVEHSPRYSGPSTYTFWKSVRVWARLAFSFSVRPLRLVTWVGFAFAALGLLLALVFVVERIAYPEHFSADVVGWASLMVAHLVLGGTQLMFFGIVGEYVARMFLRINRAPQTAVRHVLDARHRRPVL